MNFKQLQIFVTVAELGSFSKAAQKLYLSPSALTQQLNTLERYLGVTLLKRTSKGSELTEKGKLFLDYARRILELQTEAEQCCRSTQQTVRIGTYREDSANALQKKLKQFAGICPDIRIRFIPCDYREYFQRLEKGDFDLFVHPYDETLKNRNVSYLPLTASKLCCNMSDTDPLFERDQISIEDLRGRKVIVSCHCQSHCLDQLICYLKENEPEVMLETIESDEEGMEKIMTQDYLMIHLEYYTQFHRTYSYKPLDWPENIEIGVFYSANPSKPVRQLIQFLSV